MKLFRKKTVHVSVIIISMIILVGVLYGVYALFFDPYRFYRFVDYEAFNNGNPATLALEHELTKKQAVEDLDFIIKKLGERHPATINGIPDIIRQQYDEEIASFGDKVTVLELYHASSHILALMKDSHTNVQLRLSSPIRYIPEIKFEWHEDELYLINEQNTTKVVAINDSMVADLFNKFKTVYSFEIEDYAKVAFSIKLVRENDLRLIGIDTSNGITVRSENDEIHFQFVTIEKNNKQSDTKPFVYFDIDNERSLGIFTLTQCNPNEEYNQVIREFFEEVKNNGIEHIVVDLRGNGGGASFVVDTFMRYLPVKTYNTSQGHQRYGSSIIKGTLTPSKNEQIMNLVFNGDIYVLTDVTTFSAATTFTAILKLNHLAKVVGEQSGNSQEFGESLPFSVPNSHILICISNKQYFWDDKSGNLDFTMPDYPCSPEKALDKVYELIQ